MKLNLGCGKVKKQGFSNKILPYPKGIGHSRNGVQNIQNLMGTKITTKILAFLWGFNRGVVLVLCLVGVFYGLDLANFLFAGTITYNDTVLLSEVKPQLLGGVKIIYSDNSYQPTIFPFKNYDQLNLGTYLDTYKLIKITINETKLERQGYSLKGTLCHELKHYYWQQNMSYHEKIKWVDRYLTAVEEVDNGTANYNDELLVNLADGKASEFHSYYYSFNYQDCFDFPQEELW